MIYGNYFFVVVLLLFVSANAFQSSIQKQTIVSLRGGLRMSDNSSGIGWNSHQVTNTNGFICFVLPVLIHNACTFIYKDLIMMHYISIYMSISIGY